MIIQQVMQIKCIASMRISGRTANAVSLPIFALDLLGDLMKSSRIRKLSFESPPKLDKLKQVFKFVLRSAPGPRHWDFFAAFGISHRRLQGFCRHTVLGLPRWRLAR
jgi:hypothetical protein